MAKITSITELLKQETTLSQHLNLETPDVIKKTLSQLLNRINSKVTAQTLVDVLFMLDAQTVFNFEQFRSEH